jgi:uncharacterized membrane protein YphA (DoxX/SURF4 family)
MDAPVMLDPVVVIALSLLVGYVLADAGLHKLRDPDFFGVIIEDYRLLPRIDGRLLALLVGAAELAAAVAILLPWTHVGGLLAAAALLTLYFLAIAVNLARGRRSIQCGCGGVSQHQSLSGALLLRNAVLIAIALVLAWMEPAQRSLGWLDWLVSLGAAVSAALVYMSANLLLSNDELLANLK